MEMKPGGAVEYAILTQDDINLMSGNPYLEGAIIAENGAGQAVMTGQQAAPSSTAKASFAS